ncbi:MAG: dihydrolipoamide acetyltransferase family protein [Spirochaetes bacterium]|nr:dihydrolipoamide acetyltransferase family protein [Spirochaetota bacterium]
MALEVLMPQLGLTMTEGLITEWKKKPGDKVLKGEFLFSVENDKATIDVAAQADGVLSKVLVKEMVTVPVGTVVGYLTAPGEAVVDDRQGAPGAGPIHAAPSSGPERGPAVGQRAADMPFGTETSAIRQREIPKPSVDGFVLASPLARQLAESLGINLADRRGTGPEGAVLGRDLPRTETLREAEHYAAELRPAPSASSPGPAAPSSVIVLTRIQRIAAERMTESWNTIPQFTLYDEADAGRILELAERLKLGGSPVSLTVILARLLAAAAERHPLVNAMWMGDGKVRCFAIANVNVAVDTAEGLVVPVLKACASRSFSSLGVEMKELVEKARAKALGPEAYEGGTITLSNLGMFGICRFRAIVNPPQTAILAVGKISEKVKRVGPGFEARKFIEYSLTADHRAVDGVYAARFMATFTSFVENPLLLLD